MLTRRVFLEAGLGGLLLAGSMGSTACGAYAAGETQSAQNAAAMARARAKAKAAARKKYWSNFTVCIDPGHAESADLTRVRVNPYSTATQIRETGGAMGRRSGAENRVNMFIAKQIAKELRARGVNVVMTKTKNSTLKSNRARAEVANKCKADIEIRIHADSLDVSSIRGFLTCVPGKTGYQGRKGRYKVSQKAGRFMHKRICKELGVHDRGVAVRSDLAGFNWCKRPSVLFEVGVLSNPSDDALLAKKTYKKIIAHAIANATCAWLKKHA